MWTATGFCFFGLEVQNGFVRKSSPEGFEAFEFVEGAAVMALRLGMVTEEEGPTVGIAVGSCRRRRPT